MDLVAEDIAMMTSENDKWQVYQYFYLLYCYYCWSTVACGLTIVAIATATATATTIAAADAGTTVLYHCQTYGCSIAIAGAVLL